jgi:hypothetical protein
MEELPEGKKGGTAHIMVEFLPNRGVIVMPSSEATPREMVALAVQAGEVM